MGRPLEILKHFGLDGGGDSLDGGAHGGGKVKVGGGGGDKLKENRVDGAVAVDGITNVIKKPQRSIVRVRIA